MGKEFNAEHAHEYFKKFLHTPPRPALEGKVLIDSYVQPSIGDIAASFLEIIVSSIKPKRVLEIGTCLGYSTVILGHAMSKYGGILDSVEIKPSLARVAKQYITEQELNDIVTVHCCDAVEFVQNTQQRYDMIFQDGDKKLYVPLLDDLVQILNDNGMLISDDVLFPVMNWEGRGKKLQQWVAEYNETLSEHPKLKTVFLPFEDGIALSIRR